MLPKCVTLVTAVATLAASAAFAATKDDDRSYLPPQGVQSQAKAPVKQTRPQKGLTMHKARLRAVHRYRHARRFYASRDGLVRKVHFGTPHHHRHAHRYYAFHHGIVHGAHLRTAHRHRYTRRHYTYRYGGIFFPRFLFRF